MFDMHPDEFRREADRVADWIAAYFREGERYPVLSQVKPGAIREALPQHPPREGVGFEAIFQDFEQILVPGLTHWNHPGFFAYFAISASAPGVLAEFLSAALNQQAMLWRTSPAATELEQVSLDWLRQLLGLDDGLRGVIYDTASVSTLHALAAARQRVYPDSRERGLANLPPLVVYCSQEAHNSVDKAIITLGLGLNQLRKIPADAHFQMQSEALRQAIEADRAAGLTPMAVVATIGTTSTSSLDPLPAISAICKETGLWLHVDAAYAGPAAISPRYRDILAGSEGADSLVLNPHKWLFVPFDLSVLYVRELDTLKAAFSHVPEYLRTGQGDEVLNLMDTGIQLGRRFRSLKLWAILRYFGAERLAQMIEHACDLAQGFADWVERSPDFELMAPPRLSLVCFRAKAPEAEAEALNESLMHGVNSSGEAFLSHTKVNGKLVLRLAVGHIRSQARHIERVCRLLEQELDRLRVGRQ